MNFEEALECIKEGNKIYRKGWNGKDIFLYYVPAASYAPCTDIARETFNGENVPYGAYIAIKTAQGNVVPWVPSQSDLLSDDWEASRYENSKILMDFGEALELLKQGKSIYRLGWNGTNQFLFCITSKELSCSLQYGFGEYENEPRFTDIIMIKTSSNQIQAWVATQTDILSNDWVQLK